MSPGRGAPVVATPASVSVVARTCAAADAWATALMVLGVDAGTKIAQRLGIEALFLVRDSEGTAQGVAVGRLFSGAPLAIVPPGALSRAASAVPDRHAPDTAHRVRAWLPDERR